MLKARVIPTLLWKKFGIVKGVGFDSWRRVGPALPAIKVYNQREVDELILLDINAHLNDNEIDVESIEDFGQECFIPFTVGGGIVDIRQVQQLLRAGADKVCLNTANYSNPNLITDIAKKHGTQCVVASIDVRKIGKTNDWRCFSHAGQNVTEHTIKPWVKELEDRGAGEIIITSIDKDGTLEGYDLGLIDTVVNSVKIPVIASGGAGNYQHMIDAILISGASAVAAASMFHFTEQTPAEAKLAMQAAGISVRLPFKEKSSF
jgi:cyclase